MAMSQDTETLKALIAVCQEANIKQIKMNGIELEFFGHEPSASDQGRLIPAPNLADMPTDSEMIFWSSGDTTANEKPSSDGKEPSHEAIA